MNDPLRPTHQIAEIAKCSGVPRPYLAKIIGALSRKGLLLAKRGYHGGISLGRPPQTISLLEIVEAVEGDHWLGDCLLGFSNCKKHLQCPTQPFWDRFKCEVTELLGRTTLAEVLTAKAARQVARARSAERAPAPARGYRRPQALATGEMRVSARP